MTARHCPSDIPPPLVAGAVQGCSAHEGSVGSVVRKAKITNDQREKAVNRSRPPTLPDDTRLRVLQANLQEWTSDVNRDRLNPVRFVRGPRYDTPSSNHAGPGHRWLTVDPKDQPSVVRNSQQNSQGGDSLKTVWGVAVSCRHQTHSKLTAREGDVARMNRCCRIPKSVHSQAQLFR